MSMPAPDAWLSKLRGSKTYVLSSENAGDFIDALIDALDDETGGSDCIDRDTIRAVLANLLSENE